MANTDAEDDQLRYSVIVIHCKPTGSRPGRRHQRQRRSPTRMVASLQKRMRLTHLLERGARRHEQTSGRANTAADRGPLAAVTRTATTARPIATDTLTDTAVADKIAIVDQTDIPPAITVAQIGIAVGRRVGAHGVATAAAAAAAAIAAAGVATAAAAVIAAAGVAAAAAAVDIGVAAAAVGIGAVAVAVAVGKDAVPAAAAAAADRNTAVRTVAAAAIVVVE